MKMMFLVLTIVSYISTAAATSNNINAQPNKGIGIICEKDDPCENGATCGYTHGGYICKCSIGWQGDDCNKDIDECAKSPCGLGACKNTDGSYTCICPSGFSGAYCEIEIDECLETNPCATSNICVNTPGSYMYVCFCSGSVTEPKCKAGTCTAAGYTIDSFLGCYRIYWNELLNSEAREQCATDGGHLLLVNDETDQMQLKSFMGSHYAEGLSSIWLQGSRSLTSPEWVTDDGNPLPFMEPYREVSRDSANILYFEEGTFYGTNTRHEITNPFICII